LSQLSAVRFLAVGIAAAMVAGVYAFVMRPDVVEPPQATVAAAEPQVSNRATKADRHALLLSSSLYSNFSPFLSFALYRYPNVSGNGLLNDAQIAGIASRLRLTPQQAEHWPAVAAALRDVSDRYFQRRRTHQKAVPKIDVNSREVQRLIETAAPLIQQLREDQKREVRELVRIIGLSTVASRI
jgi:hypothetical protein